MTEQADQKPDQIEADLDEAKSKGITIGAICASLGLAVGALGTLGLVRAFEAPSKTEPIQVPYLVSYSWGTPGSANSGFGYTTVKPGFSKEGPSEGEGAATRSYIESDLAKRKDTGTEPGKPPTVIILGFSRMKP